MNIDGIDAGIEGMDGNTATIVANTATTASQMAKAAMTTSQGAALGAAGKESCEDHCNNGHELQMSTTELCCM